MGKIITINSTKLGKRVHLVYDQAMVCKARAMGVEGAIYTADEIPVIQKLNDESLRYVQEVKEVFGDVEITGTERIYYDEATWEQK
jgi:hypothetical protein